MHGLHEYYIDEKPKSSFRKEIRTFVLFFCAIFVIILVFTNFNLFASNFIGLFEGEIHPVAPISTSIISQDNTIASVVDTAEKNDVEIQ